MNNKKVTYLSLGSNLGNKKENIEKAIKHLKKSVGEVVKISNYYLSESWGFKSDDFLNNIVEIKTHFDPLQLFNRLKIIEKRMEAFHNSFSSGYQSRSIDIDIIYYESILYKQKSLTIPHVNMHNRKFVLLPLVELCPQRKHPLFNKNVRELLEACCDKSKINLYEE